MAPESGSPRTALLISSCGGHWQQLRRLAPAFDGFRLHWAATDPAYHQFVDGEPFHAVPDASLWSKPRLVWQALRVAWLLLRLRPHVVVSTGASVGFFALWFGKKLGSRTVWVDSMANVEQLSLSGARVRPHADLWLTQWEHLARPEGPHFHGAVL